MRAMPHPNRSKRDPSPARNPRPAEVRAAREAAGLTQAEAGDLVHVGERGWQMWEAGDRSMHPAFWELFRLKVMASSRKAGS